MSLLDELRTTKTERKGSLLDELRVERNKPIIENTAKSISHSVDAVSASEKFAPKLTPTAQAMQRAEDELHAKQKKGGEPLIDTSPVAEKRKELKSRKLPIIGPVYRLLDKVADFTAPAAEVGAELYTPGAGLANMAGFTQGTEQALAKVAPKVALGEGVGARAATEFAKEGTLGSSISAMQSTADGGDKKDILEAGAFGGLIGGAGGSAFPAAKGLVDKVRYGKELPLKNAVDDFVRNVEQSTNAVHPEGRITQEVATQTPKKYTLLDEVRDNKPISESKPQETIQHNQIIQETKPKFSSDIQSQLDAVDRELQQWKDIHAKQISSNPKEMEFNDKQLKARGIEASAKKREIIQGGSLIPVEGGLTGKELDNKLKYLRSNYVGKEVIVDGVEGRIKGNSFGKVGVEFSDGSVKYFESNKVIPKVDIDGIIHDQKLAKKPIQPAQNIEQTKTEPQYNAPTEPDTLPRKFAETLIESEKTPQTFKEKIMSRYKPQSNQETIDLANARLKKDVEEATSFVLSKSRFTAEKAATAQRLIDHFNSQGNFQRAVDIAEKVAEEATRAGQGIQALSMFDRLSVEGVLLSAQRMARRTNEQLPLWSKEVKVTEDMAAQISGLVHVNKKMTGIQDLSNNVMDILERAKSGEKLSKSDTETLRQFVQESQQFVKEVSRKPKPRPPQMPKDKRIRDNVVSFLDAQEQAAKERLRARGIQVSSMPLDVWADYAVIGASKMGKGVVKFADWSESMVKDLGENIRPHLESLYDRAKETLNISTKRVSEQTISQAEKLTEKVIKGHNLQGEEADTLRQLAQKVSNLSGDAKTTASQDLQVILQTLDKPTILRKLATVQTIWQLLNTKTQVRNALGNELFYRVERLNKYLATPIDIARSKLTGGQRTVTFRTMNQGQFWKNWMAGLKAGWKGVNVNGLETQFDLKSLAFRSKFNPLHYMERALWASLKSFDNAAYMRAFNETLGEQAVLQLVNEGRPVTKEAVEQILRQKDDNIMKIADEYGRYVTFQDNNIVSKGLVKLKRGLNVGQDFGIGDLVLKYPKTPGALLMRALEYSPAGFIRSIAVLGRPFYKREPNTREVMLSLSRAMIGTLGLSGIGYFLMDKGIVTGASSKDRDIRDLSKSAGEGQYQVNLSALMRFVKSNFDPDAAKIQKDDVLYSYDWAQPISMAVSIGANTKKNIEQSKGKLSGLPGTVYNSLEGGLGTLTEQSVLQGLRRAAEGYPGQSVTDKIMDILSDVPSSFVPTFLNQARQLQDPYSRETYDPSKAKQSVNRALNRIPGISDNLPQQYDTLGNEKKPYQNNSLFNVLLNPGFTSRYKPSPEAKYIIDLINETGDESLAPRVPSKSITIDGQRIQLSGDEFSRLQLYQGEETRKQIEKRMTNDQNKKTEKKADNIKKSLTDAGEKARKKLGKEIE